MKPLSDKERFEKAFEQHWYKNKTLSEKLVDDMGWEKECCARFFQAMKETEGDDNE